ncbi:hypothetical protein HZ326_5324 [Fusarium oxysporum f. sp. albedinis]|nr:hypothetical protein HZ326_5324 [Fusarium oxysporum f. sp. albedinis]
MKKDKSAKIKKPEFDLGKDVRGYLRYDEVCNLESTTKPPWMYTDLYACTDGADGIAALIIIMPASKPLSGRGGDKTSTTFSRLTLPLNLSLTCFLR